MAELQFAGVAGKWEGNDYPTVSMTSVSVGKELRSALVYMTHMNVDFDGSPNVYGPQELSPLDSLEDAGRYGENGYYGLMAVGPKEIQPGDPKRRLIKDVHNLKLDLRYPDTANGRCPVVQKTGPYAGYFVSTTSKRNPTGSTSQYELSHYRDSSDQPVLRLVLRSDYETSRRPGPEHRIAPRHLHNNVIPVYGRRGA
jgi:hypothetical protein